MVQGAATGGYQHMKPKILVLAMSYNYHARMAMNAANIVGHLTKRGVAHRYVVGSCQADARVEIKDEAVRANTRRFPMPEDRKVDKIWLYQQVLASPKYASYNVVWITDADILYDDAFADAVAAHKTAADFKGTLLYTSLDFLNAKRTAKVIARQELAPTYRQGTDTDPEMARMGRVPWGYCMVFHRPDLARIMGRLRDTRQFVHADRRIKQKAKQEGVDFHLGPGLAVHLYHNGSGAHWYKPAKKRF